MWLQLTKYLFYLAFFLNIVCGVWVFFGIIQWGSEQAVGPPRRERAAAHPREKRGEMALPPFSITSEQPCRASRFQRKAYAALRDILRICHRENAARHRKNRAMGRVRKMK